MRAISVLLLAFAGPAVLRAQTAADLVAAGDATTPSLHPDMALPFYQQALALDSGLYPALWRVARTYVDIAKQIEGKDAAPRSRRDSLYTMARDLAERAVRTDSTDPDGHFILALALGRLSLTKGGKERVRFGETIYDEAARAVTLNPAHDGAHHILGEWHAEVRRLSGMTRFFAKTLFGGGFVNRASWDSATAQLEKAVELRPSYIYHRLALALVYLDLDRPADATAQLEAIRGLPDSDVLDPKHRRRAEELLEEIRKKGGR